MAGPFYLRSTDGSDADTGLTWALARATAASAVSLAAATERVWASDNHAESQAGAISIAFPTSGEPAELVCGDDAAEPPTALATSGTITSTGGAVGYTGNCYVYGLTHQAAGNINLSTDSVSNTHQKFESCKFRITAATSTYRIFVGVAGAYGGKAVHLKNCDVKFAHATQAISLDAALLIWEGGSMESGGTVPTALFKGGTTGREGGNTLIKDVDLSNHSGALVLATDAQLRCYDFINCKLHASATVLSGAIGGRGGPTVRLINCDSGDTNYRNELYNYAGSIVTETTIVRTGGASDGTTSTSRKMVALATATYHWPLKTDPILIWNDTTGSAKTVTVEFIHDSVTNLQDDEIWVEVEYLGTSGFPLGSITTDAMAAIVGAASDQTDSSETWTTTGLTNPNTQKLSVSITPQEKGFFSVRVCLAKEYTAYICPKVTVT